MNNRIGNNNWKINVSNKNNIKILKLNNDYTNLSFLKNIKFSIIIANSVVQYYRSQKEIINLIKSVKKIAVKNAYFLIADMHVVSDKKKPYSQLIYNSIIDGYFISLMKMGLKIFMNKEFRDMIKNKPPLIINIDEFIKDLSILVHKVTVINENLTINPDRKHLLIQF